MKLIDIPIGEKIQITSKLTEKLNKYPWEI